MLLKLIFKLSAFEVREQKMKTIIFKMKVKVLQEMFFSFSLDVNLNDIARIKYSLSLSMNIDINEKKMIQIINRFAQDKTLEMNDIFNRFL